FDMSEGDYLAYQRATAAGNLDETRESSPLVYVRLADETEWPRKGALNFIDNQVDRGAGTIRARATFANPDFFVTPAQFGRIPIPRLSAPRRDPCPGRRRSHRSIAQGGDDRKGGRYSRVQGRPPG